MAWRQRGLREVTWNYFMRAWRSPEWLKRGRQYFIQLIAHLIVDRHLAAIPDRKFPQTRAS